MNKKGVSLVELLIVIVVLGVVAGFATVAVVNIVNKQRVGVDSYNVRYLNELTMEFSEDMGLDMSTVYNGIDTDEARMNLLITNNYLFSNLKTAQSGATFQWDETANLWTIVGGDYSATGGLAGSSINFASETIDTLESSGTVSINMAKWDTDDGYLENSTGETRIFIPISQSTYTIEVEAALSSGTGGGYGIFFHTTLRDGDEDHDDGYVFQFDRGYSTGAMIVRPRVNGRERGPVWSVRASSGSATFPTKVEDAAWWTDTHTVKIIVTNVDVDTCNAAFYIDGTLIGDMDFDNEIGGDQIYTGFRGWGSSPTKFYSLGVN